MSAAHASNPHVGVGAVALAALLIAVSAAACDSQGGRSKPVAAAPPAASTAAPKAPAVEKARYPGAPRIVAIGDLHGDLGATRVALRLAGAIDESDRWVGGSLVLVQTGDQLDRGDDERAILDLFERLTTEAKQAGGAVYVLNGNHEVMNVAGDLRYVTEGGYKDFEAVPGLALSDPRLADLPPKARPRAAAFLPGAPYAKVLGRRDVAVVVGETVFVHGGLLPSHVSYGVDRLNGEARAWMNGEKKTPPSILTADDAPIWTRLYAEQPGKRECDMLAKVLTAIPAKRMVVGHTVQKGGITSGCDGKVWRIDVGMASFYGGRPEVLEIAGEEVRAIRKDTADAPQGSAAPAPASSAH